MHALEPSGAVPHAMPSGHWDPHGAEQYPSSLNVKLMQTPDAQSAPVWQLPRSPRLFEPFSIEQPHTINRNTARSIRRSMLGGIAVLILDTHIDVKASALPFFNSP